MRVAASLHDQQATGTLSLDLVLVPRSSAVAQALPDDCVVLDLDSGRFFALGPVGGFLWSRLDGVRSLAELALAVREEFEEAELAGETGETGETGEAAETGGTAETGQVEEDLLRFAEELLRWGLVEAGRS